MAKRAPRKQHTSATPPPPARTRSAATDRPAFLAPSDVNRVGTTRLQMAGPIRLYRFDDGRVNVIAEVIIGSTKGPRRSYSMKIGSRTFIAATKRLGNDLAAWGGKVLDVEVDQTGKYVNVNDPDAPPVTAAPAAAGMGTGADDDIPF